MADNIVLKNEETNNLGRIEMAPEVLEIIIGIAAAKVDGVYSMRGSLANNISALLGRQNRGKGVKLSNTDTDLAVDVYTFLNYGVSVPKVANEIQEKVRQQVLFMTGIELAAVLCPKLSEINFSQSPKVRDGPLIRLVKSRLCGRFVSLRC